MKSIEIPTTSGSHFLFADIHEPFYIQESRGYVVLCNGLGGNKDHEHIVAIAEALAEMNFVAVRFDPTGVGLTKARQNNSPELTLNGYFTDIKAVIEFLTKRLAPVPVGLCGHSLGAMMAINAAAKLPAVRATCAIAPPTQLDQAEGIRKLLPDWQRTGFTTREDPVYGELRLAISFLDEADKWNAANAAGKLQSPLAVIAGDLDRSVLPEDSKAIYEAAIRANPTAGLAEWHLLHGIAHSYRREPEQVRRVTNLVADFFARRM